MNSNRSIATAIFFIVAFVSQSAFAYVDPGTGTLLIQWLFGMAIAGSAVLSVYWQRVKQFFSVKFGNSVATGEVANTSEEAGRD